MKITVMNPLPQNKKPQQTDELLYFFIKLIFFGDSSFRGCNMPKSFQLDLTMIDYAVVIWHQSMHCMDCFQTSLMSLAMEC